MKNKRLTKKHIPSFYFTRVPKRRKAIEELSDVPIILQMKTGQFYAGIIDDYDNGIILYGVKEFVNKEISETKPQYKEKVWETYFEEESFGNVLLKDIKNIYRAKDGSLMLDQMLDLTINPWNTTVKGIECNWEDEGKHSNGCDEDLHESLKKLYNAADVEHRRLDYKKRKELNNAFQIIRRFIIDNKGKIP